jgi:hypothetical protein
MIYIDRFRISTSSALHGTNHEKNPEEACSSKVESEKGSNEEKISRTRKNFTKEEKKLILQTYVDLGYKNYWDTLMETIYKHCEGELTSDMFEYYKYRYGKHTLTDRIKYYIKMVQSLGENETDPEIVALLEKVRSNKPVASPRGQR